jgi:hypothetical protein
MATSSKSMKTVEKPVKVGKKKTVPGVQVNKPYFVLRKDAMKKTKIA